jgi:two-component system, NarL family, nitrate/nitrite response regulator NarL
VQILLVDDHALFREALLYILAQLASNIIVHEAANIEEAAQLIQHTRNLDLILLDIDLPGIDGLSAMPTLRKLAPDVSLIILSGSENVQNIRSALDMGAVGYIPKSCNSHEMLAAMQIVLQGGIYIPPRLLGKLTTSAISNVDSNVREPQAELTKRQIEVLNCMAKGLPNKLIARELAIVEGTVKLHVFAILRILGVHNRTEAVIEAARRKLIPSSSNAQTSDH